MSKMTQGFGLYSHIGLINLTIMCHKINVVYTVMDTRGRDEMVASKISFTFISAGVIFKIYIFNSRHFSSFIMYIPSSIVVIYDTLENTSSINNLACSKSLTKSVVHLSD